MAPHGIWHSLIVLVGYIFEDTRTQSEYGLGTRNVIWVRDRGHRSQTVEHHVELQTEAVAVATI